MRVLLFFKNINDRLHLFRDQFTALDGVVDLTVSERPLKGDFDLCYCLSCRLSQVQYVGWARGMRTPIVCRVRGDATAINRGLFAYIYNYVDLLSLWEMHGLIPITPALEARLLERGLTDVYAPVSNGVDHSRFKPSPHPDTLTVGYAGRLTWEKGVQHLLEVTKHTPDVNYVIAGKNSNYIDFPQNVTLLGEVPHSSMQDFYQQVNVVLLPSYTDGFNNVLLEAYACGRPVIASPMAVPDGFPVYGYMLNHDLARWVKVIQELQCSELEHLGSRAVKQVREYTWERHAVLMLERFEEILCNING